MMRKIIYNKFDKKAITGMPTVVFPGRCLLYTSDAADD